MKLGLHEAAHEDFGIALQSQNFELDGVHQAVKQGALADFLVEDHHIEKVRECMCVTSGRFTNPLARYSS